MAPSNKLVLVGANEIEHAPQSPDFARLLDDWRSLEARLEKLYQKHDAAIGEQSPDATLAKDLLSIQIDVERAQQDLLREVAMRPARNQHDIIAKLEIWKSLIIPDGCDPELAQPSDLIVNSVLADLLSRETD